MKFTTNADDVARRLREAGLKRAKAGIRKGSRAGCKVLVGPIKAAWPVVSGRARRTFKVRGLPRSRVRVGTQVRGTCGRGEEAYYISFVELGTKKAKRHNYIRSATERAQGTALRIFVDGIVQELEKR